MNLKLEMKRVSDGMIATDVWKDWEWNTYWWAEGNASCDCNRELFFYRALELAEPEETRCSDGRYLVRCSDSDAQKMLYAEF